MNGYARAAVLSLGLACVTAVTPVYGQAPASTGEYLVTRGGFPLNSITVNLGLHGNVVYACLAETALLAMEGKLESFTLSRNIDYAKVLEIDRLAREHGVRLSHIMGHQGIISEEEFELCRGHAFRALTKNSDTIRT